MTSSLPAQEASAPVRPAKVHVVMASETELRRVYPAIVQPSQEVELSFRVGGQVTALPVRAAQSVEQGAVIAQLDDRDFKVQVAQLESQRDQAAAELRALRTGARPEEIASLEANVASARAQLEQARDEADRTRELAQRGVAASAQLDQAQANERVAAANLQAQLEQLAIGQAGGRAEDIEAAEAALRGLEAQIETAQNNLDDTTLRAPFDGIIARRDIENFTNIQAGQTIVLLQALATVDLAFDVPGPDVTAFSANGTENIRNQVIFDALPDEVFDGEFVEFSTQADAATQTYRGRIAVNIPNDVTILPGMVGRVISTVATDGAQHLTVPLSAVAANPDGAPFVWRVDPDQKTVAKVPVSLGEAAADEVIVRTGLAAGDTVVSAGIGQLQEGMEIRPVTQIGG